MPISAPDIVVEGKLNIDHIRRALRQRLKWRSVFDRLERRLVFHLISRRAGKGNVRYRAVTMNLEGDYDLLAFIRPGRKPGAFDPPLQISHIRTVVNVSLSGLRSSSDRLATILSARQSRRRSTQPITIIPDLALAEDAALECGHIAGPLHGMLIHSIEC